MMKHLNDKATAIFRKLTEGLRKVGDHQQWNKQQFIHGGLRRNHRQNRPWSACQHCPLLQAEW